jgi:TldD protein
MEMSASAITVPKKTFTHRDRSLSQLADNVGSGFGVQRVLTLNGVWGFAASL